MNNEEEILKKSSEKIVQFKDKHKGQRCIIIGNGPSLNKMDLSFLKNEVCFGLNKIYLGFEKWNFVPTYYVAVNSLVLEQNAEEIQKIPGTKFISNRGIPHIKPQEDIIFVKTQPNIKKDFSINPTQGLQEGNTVTYVAMQLAYYMGFKTVILIGLDHHFATKGEPHLEITSKGEDLNHFHPNYFGKGVKWHLPDLKGSEKFYKIAYANYWLDGRQIIDATLDGNCTIFPKENYKNIFNI